MDHSYLLWWYVFWVSFVNQLASSVLPLFSASASLIIIVTLVNEHPQSNHIGLVGQAYNHYSDLIIIVSLFSLCNTCCQLSGWWVTYHTPWKTTMLSHMMFTILWTWGMTSSSVGWRPWDTMWQQGSTTRLTLACPSKGTGPGSFATCNLMSKSQLM